MLVSLMGSSILSEGCQHLDSQGGAPQCYYYPLNRLPASRLLLPRSGLERSDFVRWHLSDMPKQSPDVCCWGKSGPHDCDRRLPSFDPKRKSLPYSITSSDRARAIVQKSGRVVRYGFDGDHSKIKTMKYGRRGSARLPPETLDLWSKCHAPLLHDVRRGCLEELARDEHLVDREGEWREPSADEPEHAA